MLSEKLARLRELARGSPTANVTLVTLAAEITSTVLQPTGEWTPSLPSLLPRPSLFFSLPFLPFPSLYPHPHPLLYLPFLPPPLLPRPLSPSSTSLSLSPYISLALQSLQSTKNLPRSSSLRLLAHTSPSSSHPSPPPQPQLMMLMGTQ